MLVSQNTILSNKGLAICGCHYKGGDTIHVGIFWNHDGEQKIFHFLNGDDIPVTDATNNLFQNYLFNPLVDFPESLIPSLSAVSELISQNKLNGFIFKRQGVIYNGGKFEFDHGSYPTATKVEKIVNCAVFVIALLNTYDYKLLEWESWPNITVNNPTFLEDWFNKNNIPADQRPIYYQLSKELRGKHVLVSPDAKIKPAQFHEVQELANTLISKLNTN